MKHILCAIAALLLVKQPRRPHRLVHVPPPSMNGHGTWRCLHPDCAWTKADGFAGSFFEKDKVQRGFDWSHEFMEADR